MPISDNHHYILSYYRTGEITGALFFGRLAKMMRPGPIQMDMTKHFSDEAAHAYYWTEAIRRLGREPLKLRDSYQDQYNEAIGIPVNIMETLAVTQVFERRVINAYARHERATNLDPVVKETSPKLWRMKNGISIGSKTRLRDWSPNMERITLKKPLNDIGWRTKKSMPKRCKSMKSASTKL